MSKLKQLREQKNLTQEELSEKSGVSVRTIQRIESGTKPKGYTLKTLAHALDISENELLDIPMQIDSEVSTENLTETIAKQVDLDFSKIKLVNLSSILFVIFPPLNILAPLLLSYVFKQNHQLTKQIVSLQILWTILAPIFFMLGIFLKLGHSFTVVLLAVIVLSNVFLILSNLAEIDRRQKLRYKLNFNII